MNKHGIKQLSSVVPTIDTTTLKSYTAMISCNYRDTNTASPKVLLRGIMDDDNEIYRDHCHVNITSHLDKVLSKSSKSRRQRSYLIKFKANTKTYNYRMSGNVKYTLENVCDVEIIG